ncbi:MAG: hypothetical protein H7831_17715 [Magnetococcus sp. WYHC-3]
MWRRLIVSSLALVVVAVFPEGVSGQEQVQFVVGAGDCAGPLNPAERAMVYTSVNLLALSYDKDNDHNYALSGMPVGVYVDFSNGAVNEERPGARPVQIASNWTSQVAVSVRRLGGEVVSNLTPRFISYAPTLGGTNEARNAPATRLQGYWAMDESATTNASGDYVVTVSWRGLSKERRLTFRAPSGGAEMAKVKLGRARALIARGAFDGAITMVDEVMKEYGPEFGFYGHVADDLMGDALEGANRLEDALAIRRARLARIYRIENPGDALASAYMRVAYLERRIAERNAGGSK